MAIVSQYFGDATERMIVMTDPMKINVMIFQNALDFFVTILTVYLETGTAMETRTAVMDPMKSFVQKVKYVLSRTFSVLLDPASIKVLFVISTKTAVTEAMKVCIVMILARILIVLKSVKNYLPGTNASAMKVTHFKMIRKHAQISMSVWKKGLAVSNAATMREATNVFAKMDMN